MNLIRIEQQPVTADASAKAGSVPLWTRPFILLCIVVLLGYAHQAILTPTIPLYVTDRGGSALLAGLVLLGFSVPSFLVRPLLGYLSDTWSAAHVLTLGLVLLAIGGLLYLAPVLALLFVAAAIRGLGWAGLNTGGYTLLAGAAPLTRRGEASGYYGSFTTSATVFFPAVALWLIDAPGAGFEAVFILSSVLALIALPINHMGLRPLVHTETAGRSPGDAPATSGMLERGVLLATAFNLSSSLAYPAVTAFLPLYAREIGIGSIGLFYVISGATGILIRPLLGKQSDAIGRSTAIAFGFIAQAIGLVLIILAQNLGMILAGGVFISISASINGSATTALAMDMASPERKGRAMATFSISFQAGAGFGAIIAGALADSVGYQGMYFGSLAIVGAGLVLLMASWRSLQRLMAPPVP